MKDERQSLTKAFGWKFMERACQQGVSLLIQIVLARLLTPDVFGILGIMIVFIAFAQVFVQTGLPTALVQRNDIQDADFSTIFYVNLGLLSILYLLLFAIAPLIEAFYGFQDFIFPFRILCLQLFPCAMLSVQIAIETRALRFKSICICSFVGMLLSGTISVFLALHGFGIWALVIQQLVYQSVSVLLLLILQRWIPKLVFSLSRAKIMFNYGWKLIASSLFESLYADLRSLIIGKMFSATELGYYDKGVKFPQTVSNAINGTLQSVMLPILSKEQENIEKIRILIRRSISTSVCIIAPMMAGLIVIAEPIIVLLLTEKWISSVPYLQLSCPSYIFFVIHTLHMQATNAIARTDITLKIQIIRKILLLAFLFGSLMIWRSVTCMIMASLVAIILGAVLDAYIAKKFFSYSFLDQVKDIIPPIMASAIMASLLMIYTLLPLQPIIVLLIQVLTGPVIYFLLAKMMKLEALSLLIEHLKSRKNN